MGEEEYTISQVVNLLIVGRIGDAYVSYQNDEHFENSKRGEQILLGLIKKFGDNIVPQFGDTYSNTTGSGRYSLGMLKVAKNMIEEYLETYNDNLKKGDK